MKQIAALFVQPDGCYANVPFVDLWCAGRDARLYPGDAPVIAHPPCQLWGNLAAVNFARWGGEHNRPGNDGGCFESALRSVNLYGGVLEHPKNSRAWKKYDLVRPVFGSWQKSGIGWVTEIWQSAYGHRANKATWLYFNGPHAPPDLIWAKVVGTHQIGFHDQRGKAANKPTLSKREANATPLRFRDELIRLAVGYAA